jgi:DeoR family transcriptional regulator, fructose operon transcriptional repressor
VTADPSTVPLLPAVRRRRILEILERRGASRVSVLSEELGVSDVTIRRDLTTLEERGLVERTHGGAVPVRRLVTEPSYGEARSSHPAEKAAIGQVAAGLVSPGDTVFLNGGTTTLEVFRALRDPSVRVITNNVRAALESEEDGPEVLLIGGHYRPRTDGVVGPFAEGVLARVYATRAFIGVEGLSHRYGLTSPTATEAKVAQLMIERTRGEIIVVADSSKLGVVADFVISDLGRVDALVVDTGISDEHRALLAEQDVDVILADADGPLVAVGG